MDSQKWYGARVRILHASWGNQQLNISSFFSPPSSFTPKFHFSFLNRGFDDTLTEFVVNDGSILGRDSDIYEGEWRICILWTWWSGVRGRWWWWYSRKQFCERILKPISGFLREKWVLERSSFWDGERRMKMKNLRTKRKRSSLRVSKEQHIVFLYPIREDTNTHISVYEFERNKIKWIMLTVSFFFPLIAQRVQLFRFKTSTSVHCCARNPLFFLFLEDSGKWKKKKRNPTYRRRYRCRPGKDLMQI